MRGHDQSEVSVLGPFSQATAQQAWASWRRGSVGERLPGPVRCHHPVLLQYLGLLVSGHPQPQQTT